MMKGIDYSKKLSDERENYWKNIDRMKKNHADDIQNVKEVEEGKTARIRNNFTNERSNIEKAYNDRYEKVDESTKATLKGKSQEYNDLIEKEKMQATNDRKNLTKDYRNRLSDIEKTFNSNNSETKKTFEDIQKTNRKNYENQLSSIKTKSQEEVESYKENAVGDTAEVSEKMNIDRKQLTESYQKEKNDMIKANIEKTNLLKEKAVGDVQTMREVQDKERIDSQERTRENFKRLTSEHNDAIGDLQNNVRDEMERLNDAQKLENKVQNKNFSNRFEEQERRNMADLKDIALENRRNSIGPGSFQYKIIEEQKGAEREAMETRLKTVAQDKNVVEGKYQKLLKDSQEQFSDQYSDLKIDHSDKLEKQGFKMNEIYTTEQMKDLEKREELTRKFDDSTKLNNMAHEMQARNERTQANGRINSLQERFTASIDEANQKTVEQVNAMREESNLEKNAIKKSLEEQSTNQKMYMRQGFIDKINKLTEGYENRISSLTNQNIEMKQKMEDSINVVLKNAQSELERQQEVFRKTAKTEITTQKELALERESQLRKNMIELNANAEKKMNELRVENERQINNLTFKYEDQIKSEREKFNTMIEQDKKFYEKEFQRLNMASSLDRERLVTQYEDRIKKMQDLYKDKQREIEHFNQLNKA